MPFTLTLIAVGGTLLRYLPFRHVMDDDTRRRFWRRALAISVAELIVLTVMFFEREDISITLYKKHLALIGIPFFINEVLTIKHYMPQHIFVLGMQTLYYYVLHATGNTVLLMLSYAGTPTFVPLQAVCYLGAYTVLLPLSWYVFTRILPSTRLINDMPFGYYIAFLPAAIAVCQLPLYFSTVFTSFVHAPSRVFTLICFFLIYKYTTLERVQQGEAIAEQRKRELLRSQISTLVSSADVMQANARRVSIIRHDMRHSIRLLYDLNEKNQRDEIRSHLSYLDKTLKNTVTTHLAMDPIINATLAIYIDRAKDSGIDIEYDIHFPIVLKDLQYCEEFALVIANLMDNAIKACMTQPEWNRHISLSLNVPESSSTSLDAMTDEVMLTVANTYDKQVPLDDDGLPSISVADGDESIAGGGHGTGMISIKEFRKKHDAILSFAQEGNIVTFMVYSPIWRSTPPEKEQKENNEVVREE